MKKTGRLGTLLLIAGALTFGAAAPAVAAPGAEAPAAKAPQADTWEFVGYYYWVSDCMSDGQQGLRHHIWKKFRCDDGSWFPGDDYELWVVY
ncbi:hypothetical protein [Actinomadura flavalba]|uniref:hypothetical protein n=1 Tax=Actinomadura flavalba TaxID=1120938 RepID=UPI0003679A00|nr:hypothetical protein [Actinomadura flavalba]